MIVLCILLAMLSLFLAPETDLSAEAGSENQNGRLIFLNRSGYANRNHGGKKQIGQYRI